MRPPLAPAQNAKFVPPCAMYRHTLPRLPPYARMAASDVATMGADLRGRMPQSDQDQAGLCDYSVMR